MDQTTDQTKKRKIRQFSEKILPVESKLALPSSPDH